ncbi:MAG: asparagine synthase (glutamine-hydrolyzing) [Parvibaculales bacterium]
MLMNSGGVISPDHKQRLARGVAALERRGPDFQGTLYYQNIALAHTRLAILDLNERSNQPYSVGDWIISFNGEIYNHLDIRKEIGQRYQFKTHSDTETLCASLEIFGLKKTLTRIAGMFAFIAVNKRTSEVHLIRDHMGIKPLLYATDSNELIVASSLKAVLDMKGVKGKESSQSANSLFLLGAPFLNETMVEGVCRVPPAHCLTFDFQGRKISEFRFWKPKYRRKRNLDEIIPVFMEYAVSDVRSSLLLSGGVDSSFLASLYQDKLECFHLQSPETDYAQAVCDRFDLPLNIVRPETKNYYEDLDAALDFHHEPLMSLGIPLSVCSEISKSGIKMAISANGADELLLGYPRTPAPELRNSQKVLNEQECYDSHIKQIRNIFRSSENYNFSHKRFNGVSTADMQDFMEGNYLDEEFPASAHFRWFELHSYVLHDLNPTLDAASMFHSIEVRVPFLDHRVVEFFLSFDANELIDLAFHRKAPIKRHLSKYFPETFYNRPKLGFSLNRKHQSEILNKVMRGLTNLENSGEIKFCPSEMALGEIERDRQYIASTYYAYQRWSNLRDA